MLRKILSIIVICMAVCHAGDRECRKLYKDFLEVIEPQVTELCTTVVVGTYSYRFYARDSVGFHNMNLVFNDSTYYLYMDNVYDSMCLPEAKKIEMQQPVDIVRTLFIPRRGCSKKFRKSIGIKD